MNFVIPWYFRMGLDTAVFFAPFVFLCSKPLLLYEFKKDTYRFNRKKNFDEVVLNPVEESFMPVEKVQEIYRELGYEEEF